MKAICVCLLIMELCSTFTSGKIRNGYVPSADQARESLTALQALVNGRSLTRAQRRTYEARVKALVDHITYYELTETLLEQFKLIAPEMYNEIDSIKDRRGRPTDVYVRFIPQEQARVLAWGTTNVSQSQDDADMYKSEYGVGTVSVKIWIVSKALVVLAHELGHVKVQVPKLNEYLSYYKATYKPGVTEPNMIGHEPQDLSGQSAQAFAKRFLDNYANQIKKGSVRPESPYDIQDSIRRRVYQMLEMNKAIASL
jgi:hypothetical protein